MFATFESLHYGMRQHILIYEFTAGELVRGGWAVPVYIYIIVYFETFFFSVVAACSDHE